MLRYMNALQKKAIILFLLFSGAVSAQDVYCDPYDVYNGYGPSGYGRRRNMPLTDISKLSKTEQEKIAEGTVVLTIEKLTNLLNLDELQVIVITKSLKEGQKKQVVIRGKENSQEVKIAQQNLVLESTDRQIMDFLNKGQKEKFKALIDERNTKLKK